MFYSIGVSEKHNVISPIAYELLVFHIRSEHEVSFEQFLLKWYSGDDYLSLTLYAIKIACAFGPLCKSTLLFLSQRFLFRPLLLFADDTLLHFVYAVVTAETVLLALPK